MSDPQVNRRTNNTVDNSRSKVFQSGKKNVLNSYRSYVYNFTLAALRKEAVNDPDLYRKSALDFVILKSGGKGTKGISTNVSSVERVSGQEEYEVEVEQNVPIREGGRILGYEKQKVKQKRKRDLFSKDFTGRELVQGFNQKSPGRFDMYMDNFEVETIMAFSKEGGTTLPSSFRFKVLEPYSINGFIEALHVGAVAAGYPSYTEASFIIKMEFVGYPDNDNTSFKSPEIVENTTRYFPIKLTGVDVEISERGTSYNVTAIPWNDSAFGQPNVLKKPITMSGNTVVEVLTNFASNLNAQMKSDEQLVGLNLKDFDEYEILFPVRTLEGLNYQDTNEIGKSNIVSILRNNSIYKFPDPGRPQPKQTPQQKESAPEEVKLHPTSGTPPQIQFAENQQINEIIAAVIRDSEYVKNILKEKKIDSNGFIDYFLIKSDVTNKDEINPVTRKAFQKYTFSVIPYKIHFTRIPGYAGQKYDASAINMLSLREYNYIYTGQNVDVLNFRLNFDKLFFEAIPAAMGINDQPAVRDSVGQPNDSRERFVGTDMENESTDQVGAPIQRQVPLPVIMDGANAGQRSNDPYYVLARNIHSAIVDSKASMVTGEIEIIGDPFYLVTGGIGNYNPKPGIVPGTTSDGEVDYLQGEVLVTINFRNPVDILPLERGGTFYFETEKVPFSGVYRVTRVQSTFNDGIFKQRLSIIRYPGQIVGKTRETIVTEATKEEPVPNAQQLSDAVVGENRGGTPVSSADALNLLQRGLPSPGLPGVLSNFVGIAGGLGGNAANLLSRFSGSVSRGLNNISSANSVFGANNPLSIDQLASGIRLKTSGLLDSVQKQFSAASNIVQSDNILKSGFAISQGADSIASSVVANAKSLVNRLSVTGSGIGEGASVLVNKVSSSDNPTAPVSNIGNIDVSGTNLVNGESLSLLGTQAGNIDNAVLANVKGLGTNANKLISSVGNKISSLTSGLPNDPSAVAAKFGINPSQLSGLGGDLQSKVLGELEQLSDDLPEDADISLASTRGLILEYVPTDKFKNIPATAPYLTAPSPEVDISFLQTVAKNSGERGLSNAFGVSSVNNISKDLLSTENLQSLKTNLANSTPFENLSGNTNLADITSLKGKIGGADNLLSSVSQNFKSVENTLISQTSKVGSGNVGFKNSEYSVASKFQSKSAGQSPLDKLFT